MRNPFSEIKFNKQELAGAFGDIGTDFPLIVAMILAAGLHAPSVLIMFGIMQIATGLFYRMPMPVQPLKAMATLVIAQKIGGNVLLGAGLAIGVVMLFLSVTGLLDWLGKVVPKVVIRGLQLGLGISLALLAFRDYIPAEQLHGYILALASFVLVVIFLDNKRYPAAILVITLGLVYAFIFKVEYKTIYDAFGVSHPQLHLPVWDDILKGFLLLALPQIPLSLGNSILATKQITLDLFPERKLTIRKIGLTYSLMNLINPFFSGVPCCHGSGGIVGHYTFGGRTGGSVILYGLIYITLGLFFGKGFQTIIHVFPLPVLGVVLLFEGIALMLLIRDVLPERKGLSIAILVGVIAAGLPYGFVISILIGTLLHYLPVSLLSLTKEEKKKEK